MSIDGGHKFCPRCKQILSVNAFGSNKSRPDRLQDYCRHCRSEQSHERRIRMQARKEFDAPVEKVCSDCQKLLPIEDFYKDSIRKDGRSYVCCRCDAKRKQMRCVELRKREHINIPSEKYCPCCDRVLPAAEFSKNIDIIDGLASWCKECQSKYFRSNKAKSRERKRRNRTTEKIKITARRAVNHALSVGKITKPEQCERADDTCFGKIVAHHPDYTKSLEVLWMCISHHAREHRTINDVNKDRKQS